MRRIVYMRFLGATVPIVLAADRSGVAFGKALNSTQAAEIPEVLRPAVAMDFHFGGGRGALLPALCAVARAAPCGPEPIRRPARAGASHPDSRQPAEPLQGVPVGLPRRGDEISRKPPCCGPSSPASARPQALHPASSRH